MLGFFELPEDDQPPQRYWMDSDALSEWFEAVKARRKEGHSASEDSESIQNEYTRDL